ncbi:hypothetical protein PanWU01x14_285170 [Parasponia andersonii]|uniref:Uncharacterized protein n=1 Tax=Parasponia andersonii TaxID=3476 RepID=A0A2P5AZP6_PARAD|nr:hypothetical protein PanWU01x14_285170 [Parasponia andersonii]
MASLRKDQSIVASRNLAVLKVYHNLSLSLSNTDLYFSLKALELFPQLALNLFAIQGLLISFLLLFESLVSGIPCIILMALGIFEQVIESLRELGKPPKLPDNLSPKEHILNKGLSEKRENNLYQQSMHQEGKTSTY